MTKLRSTKKFEIVLDSNKLKWFYMSCAAALPQLDRGSDYESERHRFESYTPHQLKSKASGNGGFSFMPPLHGFEPRSRRGRKENVAAAQVGRAFPMAAQAESTSRNPHSDWDVVSGWRLKRKLRPGIHAQTGTSFPQGSPRRPRTQTSAIST